MPDQSDSGFGDRLRELREKSRQSQEDLARAIDVNTAAVSRWERGIHKPNSDQVIALANHFGVSCDYLLLGTAMEDHGNDEAFHRFIHTEAGRVAQQRGWLTALRTLKLPSPPTVQEYTAVVRALQITAHEKDQS